MAEIARAAGDFPTIGDSMSARDVELMLESRCLEHDIVSYTSRQIALESAHDTWMFELTSPVDIEQVHWLDPFQGEHTKMSLARHLQLRDDLDDRTRNSIWQFAKDALLAEIARGPGGAHDLLAERARGRGGGRGRRGRGGIAGGRRGRGARAGRRGG